jgi:hypothetical protein
MDFTLETAEEYIPSKETRIYFKEVVSSYVNENYRSAIVMLYSVTICDLVYKMIELRDIYQDEKAKAILDDIEKMQQNNPTSSDWEVKLIKRIGEETELLSAIELKEIENLKEKRNLSAHPALTNQYELYRPTKQMTISLIYEILNAVLTKPPLLSKKVIDSFLEDIARNKDIFLTNNRQIDKKSLHTFLRIRYFNHMGDALRKHLFRLLWKFIFITDDPQCNANRQINFMALYCLYQTYDKELLNYIKLEPKYFSVKKDYLNLLYDFLIVHPEIFDNLQEDAKILTKQLYEQNDVHARILGVFISNSFEQHCDMLSNFNFGEYEIPQSIEKDISLLYDYSNRISKPHYALRAYIKIFANSRSFNEAYKNFNRWIRQYLDFMEEKELSDLLDSIETNSQIYNCWDIQHEFGYINSFMQKFWGNDFNLVDKLEREESLDF